MRHAWLRFGERMAGTSRRTRAVSEKDFPWVVRLSGAPGVLDALLQPRQMETLLHAVRSSSSSLPNEEAPPPHPAEPNLPRARAKLRALRRVFSQVLEKTCRARWPLTTNPLQNSRCPTSSNATTAPCSMISATRAVRRLYRVWRWLPIRSFSSRAGCLTSFPASPFAVFNVHPFLH